MPTESLILRRSYPVPMTLSDLKRAHTIAMKMGWNNIDKEYRATRHAMAREETPPTPSMLEDFWHAAIKEATGALDEVYAVIDGREVRVSVVSSTSMFEQNGPRHLNNAIAELLIKADEDGYWQRPHEIVHVLSERPVSFAAVERAVNVGWCAKGGAA